MPEQAIIRVLIVDDHTLFRSGIKSVLQRHPGFEVIDEAGDGLEGIKRAKSLQPDVVLLDLHMPGISGPEAIRLMREQAPQSKVLMLTVSEDGEDLMATLQAGAAGYLVKNIDTAALIDGIRRAAYGETVISPLMMGKLVQGMRRQTQPAPPSSKDRLSPREREIMGRLARGESNKEIARAFDLAESTIKIHLQNIFKKLNLTSRVQAAVFAIEHGIGQPAGKENS
ncbi:MAG TPA: response regulator transcription factor [Rhodocyclaceae bacterium]|nr:response regulator transcription factor [Rhodocyclaceae bacterium]